MLSNVTVYSIKSTSLIFGVEEIEYSNTDLYYKPLSGLHYIVLKLKLT